jgi:hypothetical protein
MSATLSRPSKSKASNVAEEINRLHKKAESSSRVCLENAIKAGEMLVAEKAKHDHGEWGDWIEANLAFTWRTANYYMRLFKRQNDPKLEGISNLTITDAQAEIERRRISQQKPNDANDQT